MINTSISFGISNEKSLEKLRKHSFHIPIQLSIAQNETFFKFKEDLVSIIKDRNILVNVVHLPINCLSLEFSVIVDLMDFFYYYFYIRKFVIHPNRSITKFLNYFMYHGKPYELCIENFLWKRKKELRSPLQIYDICKKFPNVKITFDTSHSEVIWFEDKIFSYFLPEISVIHLSNRVNRRGHYPFTVENGELNLINFISKLRRQKWSGDIVLEYLSDYSSKLYPNWLYLNRLLGSEVFNYNRTKNKR
jgi:hypothetical protein